MKRRYALTGLGLVAALALVTTAIAGGDLGSYKNPLASSAAKKKAKPGPPGPQGPAGPQGAQGSTGAPGQPGAAGATNVVVRTANLMINEGASNSADVPCVGNERATGGGYSFPTGNSAGNEIIVNGPPTGSTTTPPTSWRLTVFNSAPGGQDTYAIHVICASP